MIKPILKPGKKIKTGKTKEEAAHLNWIASLPCSIKGCPMRSNVHHIRKYGEPKDHFKTIPLCRHHHQEKEGIHDGLGKKRWEKRYGLETDYLNNLPNKT
jgi:hypothetical protein